MDSDAGYLSELLAEKDSLDPSFVHCMRLLTREINRIQSGEPAVPTALKTEDEENLNGSQTNEPSEGDVQEGTHNPGHIEPRRQHRDHLPFRRHFPVEENKLYKPVKLSEKVYIPVKEHPKFNFVGKLLGPRGNTFKRLQNSTGTKMSILGKGSMRDKEKEEELKSKGDPKYEHLGDELHVLIEVEAPPGQAHARLGIAIEEIKKYLNPDTNDEIHQEQMREMAILNSLEDGNTSPSAEPAPNPPPIASFPRGRGRARPIQGTGRGVHISRQGHPVAIRRVQQGHQISLAARSAAGLPSSSVPARAQAPGAIDPFGDTYDPAYAFEAAYAEPEEGTFYEYGRGVTPEIFETAYPAPGRLPTSMAANYKTTTHRPTKKIIREATYPY